MPNDNRMWCQNKKCPEKKNVNQIRGTKGKKYYQSSKANGYGSGNFCTLNCFYDWANKYIDQAIDNLGIRIGESVKLPMEMLGEKTISGNIIMVIAIVYTT